MTETLASLDSTFWITCGVIFLLLVLSGFFSGSETALTAASRGKLRVQADKGSVGAQRALRITEDNERLIGSVLLGNNVVNILATSLATFSGLVIATVFGSTSAKIRTSRVMINVAAATPFWPKTLVSTAVAS